MRGVRWLGLCALFVGIGCGRNYHVDIPAPPPNLSPQQRVAAYQALRQGGSGVELTTSCQRGTCSTRHEEILILRDGTEIREADDLLPILSPTSVAGRNARKVADSRHRITIWKRIGWSGFVGGIALIVVGAKLDSPTVAQVGLGTALGIPLVSIGGTSINEWRISRDTAEVFGHYDQGLAERFGVCVSGLAMVACELNTPGTAPPPPEPDPVLRSLRQK